MSIKNNSDYSIDNENVENNTMPNFNNNNTFMKHEDSFFNKNRKDPKKMTMEELDDFLMKNNINDSSNMLKKLKNKESFNYSQSYSQFNESSKINSNTNANSNNSNLKDLKKEQKKSVETRSELENSPTKSTNRIFYFDESQNFNKIASSNNSGVIFSKICQSKNQASQEKINNNFFSEDNFVLVKSNENYQENFIRSPYKKDKENDYDQLNLIRSPEKIQSFNETDQFKFTQKSFNSPTKDQFFNFSGFSDPQENITQNDFFNMNKLNITNENIMVSPQNINFQSIAAKNVIKVLQDKNNLLMVENEDLKKTILEQNKFYSQSTEAERLLKEEIAYLKEEKNDLLQRLNKSQVDMSVLNSNLSILEKEKLRHLDYSAEEKEQLNKKFNELKMENYKINSENKKISESFNKYKLEIDTLNKEITTIRKENLVLKKNFQMKIASYNKDLDELKQKFTLEKSDLIDKISKLNEFINNLQSQKKEIINDCETKINKIKSELMNIQDNKVKMMLKTINPIEPKGGSRYIKLKTNENAPKTSRSKSKENKKPISANNRRNFVDNLGSSAMKVHNNTYYKKVAPFNANSYANAYNNVISQTNSTGNVKITKSSQKSREQSALDLKENMGIINNITISGYNDCIESEKNTIETVSLNQNNQNCLTKGSFQKRSNSCLDLMKLNAQNESISKDNQRISSNQKNVDVNDSNKFNDINDMIFNLERNIAELNRNYQSLTSTLKNTTNQSEQNQINRKLIILNNNLQIQTEKLNDLKNCQKELLMKGAIKF